MARNYDYSGDPCGEFGTALREVNKLQDEVARLRLTDAELEAIRRAADWLAKAAESRNDIHTAGYLCDDAAVLRGLLGRLH